MNYKGYNITEIGDRIRINNVRDFDPVHIFECGQCFRWQKQEDGSYTGVAKGKVVNISYKDGVLEIINSTAADFINIWFDYFDLARDYSKIKELLAKDEVMKKAIEYGHGIRILKQDLWETLISFIISANNRIPMIMKVVDSISNIYGEELIFNDKKYYTFPSVKKLGSSSIEELLVCKGGFRCKYIIKTSTLINEGKIDLQELTGLNTEDARKLLTNFPGVGNKVADCTLLYSGTKQDVFPTDVWVKRVMEELYFKREATLKEIQEFARDYFGDLSGVAQQYLFYYARENKIGQASK